MIAATSTGPVAEAAAGADWAAGVAAAAVAAAGAAEASDGERPNMADMMFPKILIAVLPELKETPNINEYLLLCACQQGGLSREPGEAAQDTGGCALTPPANDHRRR
jgi:hypothetical protein